MTRTVQQMVPTLTLCALALALSAPAACGDQPAQVAGPQVRGQSTELHGRPATAAMLPRAQAGTGVRAPGQPSSRAAGVRRTGFVPAAAAVLHWPWLRPSGGAAAPGLTGNASVPAHRMALPRDLDGPAQTDARKGAVIGGVVTQRR